ncbi:serine/arginine repetitive matrix protein 1 isoform X2 [Achroia grisella]|uniref:serine/arginine repetitive matrix protein 1 isoform X2 n=1 Tax=Achroia grisella TaxID=688607 RepID=UPI0027D32736|nr:serine/arginine repetitive matrix protein 1 isoform X2 [Achroia grisella]
MPANKKFISKIRQIAQWILVVHVVEFIEAYCTPRDTARRSPLRSRRSREPRRSPDTYRWKQESRRSNYDFDSCRRPYDYESRRGREYDGDSGRRVEFDAESARRRADYESARRTDFDLSVPGVSRRSPESAPEGSTESPPEPAPSAPLRHERSRHRSQPYYESESSSENRTSSSEEDEDEFGEFDPFATAPSLHSPDSGRSDPRYANAPRRNPSPYYYGDLFKTAPPPPAPSAPTISTTSSSRGPRYRKSASLDAPHVAPRPNLPKRFSVAEDGFRELERSSSSSGESAWMPPRRRGRDAAGYACAAPDDVEEHRSSRSVFYVPAPLPRWPQEMTTRQIYETAFDCKIARSDDDLDDFDRVSNHPALLQAEERKIISSASSAFEAVERSEPDFKGRRKVTMKTDSVRRSKIPTIRQKRETDGNTCVLSEELEKIHIEEEDRASTSQLPLRGYTPSPPSTAPLPAKFQKDGSAMNSIKSAPNLPQSQPAHPRLKDLRLPVKSLRARETPTSSDASMADVKGSVSTELDMGPRLRDSGRESRDDDDERQSKDGIFLEIKGRPTSDSDTPELNRYKGPKGVGPIMEFKGRPSITRPRRKYSSTESMATSSSGGSMESLRSSNSEGDRSSSSSESRHSSSLSSHSSDSGNVPFAKSHHMQLSGFGHHPTKLHILSPISDKSSQEPGSETSDNNKNNNSQKVSPEDGEKGNTTIQTTFESIAKPKRRALQNRNLLNLTFRHSTTAGDAEIQGSDSGISIHSREGVDSRNAFINFKSNNTEETRKDEDVDFSDLPFDMPKLRRRRAEAEADLRSLPFDMPKLRRKLRGQSLQLNSDFGGVISNASSSQSVQDLNQDNKHRAKLTLNFDGGSSSKGLRLNLGPIAPPRDLVDASLPLDRQGWYHGTLSRVEAEGLLRDADEGAFLVRNSESAKHDYSLSLKSTRGFMHMRICRSVEGYTLGGAATAFPSVPALMKHYVTAQRLPVRGAEHMALSTPLQAVLL